MRISELLHETTIKVGLDAKNKTTAIEELIDLLVEEHEISLADRGTVINTVLQREEMMSTGMEHGIAIPHGAVECVNDVVAALGISKGIDFESMDGEPAQIIVLLILPKDKYTAGVRTMAGITKLLTHDTLREKITNATDSMDVMAGIIEEEERQFLERN
ncbi:hypothetical protein BVX99_02970 [bacterium F16]|nr:hypothetical protein BVX99_02970 [bacterium F16]